MASRRSFGDRFRIGIGRVFGNFGYKILAFLIAVIIWGAVISGRPGERVIDVSVHVITPSSDLIIEGYAPETVAVKITGKRHDLLLINPGDFRANVETGELATGEHFISLTASNIEYTGDLDVKPQEILGGGEIRVNIEKRVLKSVPIVVSYDGRPRDGFFLGLPEVTPTKTTIYGPESVLKKVDSLRIEIPVSGRDTSVSANRELTPPLPGITILGENEVKVEIDVASGIIKDYKHVPISVVEDDTLIARKAEPRGADVTLKGHPDRLAAFTRPEVYIDLNDTPDDEGLYKVRVKAGKQIEIVRITPLFAALAEE